MNEIAEFFSRPLHEILFPTPYHMGYYSLIVFYFVRYVYFGYRKVGFFHWARYNLLEFILACLFVPIIVYNDKAILLMAQSFDDPLQNEDGSPSNLFYFAAPIIMDTFIAIVVHWQSVKDVFKDFKKNITDP